jgi:hypothetical protein
MITVANAEHLPAFIDTSPYGRPDSSVHTGGVTTAGQNPDFLYHQYPS